MMDVLHICAVVICFISLLLLTISLWTDYWVILGDIHGGLWNSCIGSLCVTIGSGSAKLNIVRTAMLIGMTTGAVSFFGLCVTFCKSRLGSISLAKISENASLLAGLSSMIAMSIFTSDASNYGWSFGLGWASFPLFLITSSLAYVIPSGTEE